MTVKDFRDNYLYILILLLALTAIFHVFIKEKLSAIENKPPARLNAGVKAPDFEAKLLNGGTFRLSDNINSYIILYFFDITNKDCLSDLPFSKEFAASYPNVKIMTLYSNSGDEASLNQFRFDNSLSDDCALDRDGSIFKKYKITRLPTAVFIKDKTGKIELTSPGGFSAAADKKGN